MQAQHPCSSLAHNPANLRPERLSRRSPHASPHAPTLTESPSMSDLSRTLRSWASNCSNSWSPSRLAAPTATHGPAGSAAAGQTRPLAHEPACQPEARQPAAGTARAQPYLPLLVLPSQKPRSSRRRLTTASRQHILPVLVTPDWSHPAGCTRPNTSPKPLPPPPEPWPPPPLAPSATFTHGCQRHPAS